MGVGGNLFRWFTSYVENRCQTVVLNGYTSRRTLTNIPSGVPQGSLLGPLLFNIFINDIDNCFLTSKIILYADDLKVMKQINRVQDAIELQEDLNRFQAYCKTNKLDLNVNKCYVCSFTRKHSPIFQVYKLLDTPLSRVSNIKDLGVTFDSKLLFDTHIYNIVSKASKALGFLLRVSADFKNIKTIKILYCSLVRSHLEYCSQVWNPMYNVYIDRIERIQRRFLGYIQYRCSCYLPDYVTRCKKFHILPLIERRKIADLSFLFGIMRGAVDSSELVSKIALNVPTAHLRGFNLLHVPIVDSKYRQNSYMIRASRMYNAACRSVDIDIFSSSVTKFKKQLGNVFFDQA
ncbi:unnamed protein product [Arctia plantaginis]|uniref:Reverse transcriptase domain-containing protein n=1 Tax=Arctia plantaginis TaxID=874455 RepID=A0A8S1AEB8_ARCPL|nr:unnamed protein product [Arctia plantaginis]